MSTELRAIYERLMQAIRVEEIFGDAPARADAAAITAQVRAEYHRLSRLVHPDLFARDPDALDLANEACARLNDLYQRAQSRIASGIYGVHTASDSPAGDGNDSDIDLRIRTRRREYHLTSVLAEGDLAMIYGGTCIDADTGDAGVVAKLVTDPADNPMLQREADALRKLWSDAGPQTKHLPVLLDQFKTTDGQLGNVLRRLDALDGLTLRERLPRGVPAEHVLWIWERLLSVLGYAHSRGMLHGNIEPAHIMVRPRDHNVFLIDWCYSILEPARTGDSFKCFNPDFHAPEVQQRGAPTPAADLFAVGKCMIHLLGGDPATGALPPAIDERLQRFAAFFLRDSPRQRAQDAWEMHGQLRELRTELFGPPRFVAFTVE